MKVARYNKDGSTKHANDCKMVFGRKDAQCPRCVEMINGSTARTGWQKTYYAEKKASSEMFIRALAAHNCEKSGCMVVCTFGDW